MFFTRLANGIVKFLLVIIIVASIAVMSVIAEGTGNGIIGFVVGIAVFIVGIFVIMGIGVMTELAVNIEKIKEILEDSIVNVQNDIEPISQKSSDSARNWICDNCGSVNKPDAIFCINCGISHSKI